MVITMEGKVGLAKSTSKPARVSLLILLLPSLDLHSTSIPQRLEPPRHVRPIEISPSLGLEHDNLLGQHISQAALPQDPPRSQGGSVASLATMETITGHPTSSDPSMSEIPRPIVMRGDTIDRPATSGINQSTVITIAALLVEPERGIPKDLSGNCNNTTIEGGDTESLITQSAGTGNAGSPKKKPWAPGHGRSRSWNQSERQVQLKPSYSSFRSLKPRSPGKGKATKAGPTTMARSYHEDNGKW